MSITSGFFDSQNHDRKYNAVQFGSIFDGVIADGVYSTIGTQFQVKATSGLVLNVGIGRAWFDHSWILNDAIHVIEAPASDLLLKRIDAVVLDIDTTTAVRSNTIKYIEGAPGSNPANPTLISVAGHHQYPLAYISRSANSTSIAQADITNMVGTDACPFVAGVAGTVNIDDLLAQWDDEFGTWFEGIKGQLSTDAAGNLQTQIDQLTARLAQEHRVGSLYFSDDPTSPASLFGGTWEQIKDCFILAAGDVYAAGSTGGEAEHVLTVAELAAHGHAAYYADAGGSTSFGYNYTNRGEPSNANTSSSGIVSTGGSQPHNNMPPYRTAYCWRKIADGEEVELAWTGGSY